ncbi:hypothetical protein EVAR_73196_1 [Eumeta japonica]|uniref:Uncharacterized protein n=1 Tax=Eumeta variegata TaxID=151549 RepID=A0A4C1SZZ8_EUMVA|nr:hypothetical protein EVAR_73196_1 [Eumeta japonica]
MKSLFQDRSSGETKRNEPKKVARRLARALKSAAAHNLALAGVVTERARAHAPYRAPPAADSNVTRASASAPLLCPRAEESA